MGIKAGGGAPIATMELEFVARIAGLEASMKKIEQMVGKTMRESENLHSRAERSALRYAEALEKEAAAIGKTAIEIKKMEYAANAAAAAEAGYADIAARILRAGDAMVAAAEQKRQDAIAAQQDAEAVRAAAQAHAIFEAKVRQGVVAMREKDAADRAAARDQAAAQMQAEAAAAAKLAAEHAQLAAQVRASHAAQEADAIAAERLRASTDPLYAAVKRLNAEIAESTRLYHAGATAPAEYARQQEVLAERLRAVGQANDAVARGHVKIGHSLTQLSFQGNDIITMYMAGASAGQIFATQAGQIVQVVQMAEGGFWGLARAAGAALLPFAPLIIVAGLAAGGLMLLNKQMNEDSGLKEYAAGLGLTHKEMKKLGDVSVTAGDMIKGLWMTVGDSTALGDLVSDVWTFIKEFTANFWDTIVGLTGGLYTVAVGTYRGFVATWDQLPAAFADIFIRAVNAGIEELNGLGRATNKFLGVDLFGQIDPLENAYAGAADKVGAAWSKAFSDSRKEWNDGLKQFSDEWTKNSQQAARDRLDAKAKDIIADRTEKKSKADKEAEKAARELARTYDQIISKLDPMTAATNEYEKTVAKIDKLLKAGLLGEQGDGKLGEQYAAQLKQAARELKLKAEDAWVELKFEPIKIDTNKLMAGLEVVSDHYQAIHDLGRTTADQWAEIADNIRDAASGLGSFGRGMTALVDGIQVYATSLDQAKKARDRQLLEAMDDARLQSKAESDFARASARLQVGLYGDIAGSAKEFFERGSAGYKALAGAEKAFRAVQLAMSIRAMAQDAAETASSIANSVLRTGQKAVEAVVSAISSLPFPLNLAAGAATIAALASIGVSIAGAFGGGSSRPQTNQGTGTVFGDSAAKSDSIKRSIDLLADLDTEMLVVSRQMAASLKTIESNIGGLTNLVIRLGGVDGIGSNAADGVNTGFKRDLLGTALEEGLTRGVSGFMGMAAGMLIAGPLGGAIGLALGALTDFTKKIPIIGDILGGIGSIIGGLFGTKTKVVGSGIFGAPQTLADIDALGFTGQTFADIQKKKKFLGVTTSTKYSTRYGDLDASLEDQFGKLLLSFADAIKLAAEPLGLATGEVEAKLNAFVVNIGKIDLKGLSGEEIQEKLTAVFGQQADLMAQAVIDLQRFQKVGEGAFETLVRVASTVDVVTTSLQQLGLSSQSLGIDASMAIADLFGGAQDYATAANAYFEAFYSDAEQAAARAAQLGRVFDSLGVTMPDSIAAYRALVEAQDLTTAAGQQLYAQLLQLAPAFAEIVSAGKSAASAAAILRERQDLEKQLLELQGNTVALRQRELEQLDPSNRALQMQIWAIQDQQKAAQDAASAAKELADAWGGVGDSIMAEVKRIRGLDATAAASSYQTLAAQFSVASAAARRGDMDAAKSLPELSRSLLDAAAGQVGSRRELDLIRGQTAASLEQTYRATEKMVSQQQAAADLASLALQVAVDQQGWWQSFADQQAAAIDSSKAANDALVEELQGLRAQVATLAEDQRTIGATLAGNTGKVAKFTDNVTRGGDSIIVEVEGTVKTEAA